MKNRKINRKTKRITKRIRYRRRVFLIYTLLSVIVLSGCGENGLKIETQLSEDGADSAADSETGKNQKNSDQMNSDQNSTVQVSEISDNSESVSENEPGTQFISEISSSSQVVVYLSGAVMSEGLYSLDAGSRVGDALELAGGYAGDAARGYVNLARILSDGEMIYFPTEEEVENGIAAERAAGQENEDGRFRNKDSTKDSTKDSMKIGESGDSRVNINTAELAELTTLPGIGESRAKDILAYREANGDFTKIEDLMKVPGIKEGTFNKLKDLIKVQ